MENYFILDNYRKRFSVIINNNYIYIFRISNRDKIWEGLVKNIFIGKSCLNEMDEIFYNPDLDGNTILLELEEKKYMFIGNKGVYTFETEDKIIKFISNVLNDQVPYAYAYGERNIYYLSNQFVYIPYESIQNEKRISEMDESYEPYEFLYDTRLGTKLKSLTLIATRFSDDDFEEYFNYLMTCTLEDLSDIEDEIEMKLKMKLMRLMEQMK